MTTNSPSPALDCPTPTLHGPHSAEQAAPQPGRSAPKGVAEGVPTALLPDPRTSDGRQPVAWLTITAPGRGTTPTARSWCACGRDRFATGQRRVLALITDHDHHRTTCPHRTSQEGSAAA